MLEICRSTYVLNMSNRMIQIVIVVNQTFNFVEFLRVFYTYFVNSPQEIGND